jgi:hypothetical protein
MRLPGDTAEAYRNSGGLESAHMMRQLYRRLAEMRSGPVREWVVRVDQPMLWLFQMARSGGTMTLRLFDGHPQVHVHPEPIAAWWPSGVAAKSVAKAQERYSLARFHRVGWQKKASNQLQQVVPIYFDQGWFRQIFRQARPGTPRELIDAACTARFNAWRNYQGLYGAKRFQLLHSTIWHHMPVAVTVERFFAAYPDGYILFIARCPEDWLASLTRMSQKNRPRWLQQMEDYLAEYATSCELFLGARHGARAERMIVLEFNRLVQAPRETLEALCARLGIAYHSALETTTVNGIPVGANSSYADAAGFAPDPSRIGRGAQMREAMEACPSFARARRAFDALSALALAAPAGASGPDHAPRARGAGSA